MDVDRDELLLLAETLRVAGCVWAEDEARVLAVAADSRRQLRMMVARRCTGDPLEYVVGSARFCGLDVHVGEGVFIPRRRSEYVARCAVTIARSISGHYGRVRALDVCCGSGAIALVLSARVPNIEVWATDISEAATACARRNLEERAIVLTGDLLDPLAEAGATPFDLIVANVPYVPTREIDTLPSEARRFEPLETHDGGEDGLALLRRLLDQAGPWLSEDGMLLAETGLRQATSAEAAARDRGFGASSRTCSALQTAVVVATRNRGASTTSSDQSRIEAAAAACLLR